MKFIETNKDIEDYSIKSKKTFNELLKLIELATSMQETILKQKNEVRRISFGLATIIYILLMILFIMKFYAINIFNVERFLQLTIITFGFIVGISIFSLFRIKTILSEMKVERAAMQELMEVIFNLRKVIPRNSIDLVDMTVLDLRLKRLRFY